MTTERETLTIIGSWMEEGRTRLPGHVLDAVLDQLPSTPQRRTLLGRPWSFPPMTSFAKPALTFVAIAAVGVVGLTLIQGPVTKPAASPSPTPSPSPVTPPPSPFTQRFDSAIHGLSIAHPAGWGTTAATEPWNHDSFTFGASDVDVIFDPRLQADLHIALVSEPLRGVSGEAWVSGVNADGICGAREDGVGVTGGSYTLDGARGWAEGRVRVDQSAGCQYVAVATATRGYIISLHVGDEQHPEAYDWGWFNSVLETVNLRPEDAVDGPNPAASPSPTASPTPLTQPPPLTERFDSPLHGLSITYPEGWQTRPATEPWARGALAFDAPEVDVIFDPTLQDDLFIAVASEPLNGQAPEDWCCTPRIPTICEEGGGGHSGGSSTLGGVENSFASEGGCGPNGRLLDVVAATASRGYIIQVYLGNRRAGAAYDWDWFMALLERVDLHPVDAP